MVLPPTVPHPNEDHRRAIVDLLKEENANMQILQDLIVIIKKNNTRLIRKYDDKLAAWEQQGVFDDANNGWGNQQN